MLRAIFDNHAGGVLVVDSQGKIVSANAVAEQIFGYPEASLAGKDVAKLFPNPEEPASRLGMLATILSMNHPNVLEVSVKHETGYVFPVELVLTSLETKEHGLVHICLIKNNMRREVSEKIDHLVHALLRRVLRGETVDDFAPYVCEKIVDIFKFPKAWIGTKEKDGYLRVRGCSGISSGEIGLLSWANFAEKEAPAVQALRNFQTAIVNIPDSERPKKGEEKIYQIISFPLISHDEVMGVLEVRSSAPRLEDALFHRIETLALRLSMALQIAKDQSSLRLQGTAIASTATAIFITDKDGNIEWVNAAFTKLSGYLPEEVLGKKVSVLKSGMQSKEFYANLWSTISRGEVWGGEIINRHKLGSLFFVDQTITPIMEKGAATHFVVVQDDLTERKNAEERIIQLSNYDQLTGMPNRRMFQETLRLMTARARAKQQKLGVLCLDLSNFNRINDTLGHAAGDQLLKIVAERIQKVCSPTDVIARIGGDDFAMVSDNLPSIDHAGNLAYSLIEAIMETCSIQGEEINIGACVGIAIFPDDGEDPEKLLNYADMALHKAVKNSPNSYFYFSQEMNAETEDRITLERDLRRALQQQEFLLYYQPQVDVRTGKIAGWEALLRWSHPDRGMISPGKFIPIAEDTGLIIPLGDWVIREALWQCRKWRDLGLFPGRIAINLSGAQFQQEDLARTIELQLQETGVSPESLEFELTESVIMQDVKRAALILHDLSELGIMIAIDDFGTGYSSLNYLKRFPVNRLKIDQSFVREMTSDTNDAEISRAIITLGHTLDMEIVSEGVENEAQFNLLREQGCDIVQGYLFGYPMPADQVFEFMKNHSTTTHLKK